MGVRGKRSSGGMPESGGDGNESNGREGKDGSFGGGKE